ncbi:MAG: LLM class flavin-dependent oxidoreductase [Candidatus Tectomicrobia bacterium]|uniref:LLM class flavin-dependent oxidoreductase n=1 Tax=Tectimicrobiota bacterium TaxID=2528274 RepID=A0A932HXI8_UNCTE|nr:LLM class flavin-dependent oxidoreductase [Candidatus Tectomicrobia bacterium]
MKVGLFITNQQRLDRDMVAALDEQYAMVRHARENGWDSLFTGQHYLNEGNNQQLQLVPFLARLQAEAGAMTLGLGILLINLHNPVYVAETVASLDVICRGNFVFGVGLGYREVEFDAFRVPKGQRVRRFEECLALVKKLWTGEEITWESEVCKLDRVRMNIRPVQKPHPPVWVAANNDKAVERAARLGDTWFINPHATTATNKRQMALFRAERARSGKPFPKEVPCIKEVFCGRDRRSALELAGPYLLGKYKDYATWGQDKAMPAGESFDKGLDELLEDRFILGSPEECFAQLRPYWEELGVNHLVIRTHWAGMPAGMALQSMELISKELLPALRKV